MVWIKLFHLLLYLIPISYFEMFYDMKMKCWNDFKLLCWAKTLLVWVLDLSIVFHLEFIEYLNTLLEILGFAIVACK
jgi:hypothetical protein